MMTELPPVRTRSMDGPGAASLANRGRVIRDDRGEGASRPEESALRDERAF